MRSRFAILLAVAVVCATIALAGWSPAEQITSNRKLNDLRFVSQDHVVVAANGVRHLVWYNTTGVLYKRFYPGSGWTADYKLGSSSSLSPAIALDPNGTDIHVVWRANAGKYAHVFYQKCVPGSSGNGGWVGSPKDITPQSKSSAYWPAVACYEDVGGVKHVVVTWFRLHAEIGFCEFAGGQWGTEFYFADPTGAGRWTWDPSIAVDPQARYGDVFIACLASGGAGEGPDGVYAIRRENGSWQYPWERLTTLHAYPAIAVDPATGYPHIVCSEEIYPGYSAHVLHTYWEPNSGWQPLELIPDPNVSVSACGNMSFANGSAFVVWSESSSASDRGIRYKTGGYGNWSAPAWVISGRTAGFPDVASSSTGNVYVVWGDGNCQTAPCEIWGRLYTPGGGGSQAEPVTLSQSRIELFPNPVRAGRVTVEYALPHEGPMTVTLLDVSGRAIRHSALDARSSGEGSFALDVQGLNAGVYVMRLEAGTTSQTRKLVIQ